MAEVKPVSETRRWRSGTVDESGFVAERFAPRRRPQESGIRSDVKTRGIGLLRGIGVHFPTGRLHLVYV
jgi:hypothetical protein